MNDAFGAAHRAHASTVGILRHAGRAYSGLLLDRELRQLRRLLSDPPRPFALVTGGAKIGGKIAVLQRLLPLVDRVLVGGGMANTLLAARGAELGSSLVEEDGLDIAREIVARTAAQGAELVLPDDLVVTNSLEAVDGSGNSREVRTTRTVDGVPAGWLAVDIWRCDEAPLRGGGGGREDPVLERPDGSLRDAAVRRRELCRGASRGGMPRVYRGRWRRNGRRSSSGRP